MSLLRTILRRISNEACVMRRFVIDRRNAVVCGLSDIKYAVILSICSVTVSTDRREILHDGTYRSRTQSPLLGAVPQGSQKSKILAL